MIIVTIMYFIMCIALLYFVKGMCFTDDIPNSKEILYFISIVIGIVQAFESLSQEYRPIVVIILIAHLVVSYYTSKRLDKIEKIVNRGQ
jgi:hypothetical protein